MATDEVLIRAAIRDEISGPLDKIRRELRGTGDEVEKVGKRANIGARGFDKMAGGAGRLAKMAGTGLAVGLGAATVAMAGLAVWVGKGATSLMRIERIGAQTNSVIRSTGGAANVTRKHIDELAGGLEALTGVEAESITEGQNLLLTFKNIKNGAGDGNKIFDRATTALVDMSTAMGTDASGSAIQLGKALNDPVKGIAALSRVGITFTKSQEEQIKAMVASGDTMKAQKMILQELESQFGGSAKAFGDTDAGKIERFKHAVGTLQETIASAFAPTLGRVSDYLVGTAVPALESWGAAFESDLQPKIQGAISNVEDLVAAYSAGGMDSVIEKLDAQTGAGGRLETAWDKVKTIANDVATLYTDSLKPAFDDVAGAVPLVVSPVTLLDDALGFLADNADLVRVALTGYITAITLAKVASVGYTVVTALLSALMVARVGIHALLTGSILTNTGAELTRNQALAASIAIHLRLAGALLASAARTVASTVATVAMTIASKVARGAALAWAAAQWLLNAAMTANPIGIVVALVAGLVVGLVIAYRKSDTFRAIVDKLWGALKTAGKWVADLVVKVGKFLLKWTPMGAAITLVKDNFDSVKAAIKSVIDWLGKIKMPKALSAIGDAVGGLNPFGDTATSRARGGGALGSTMAAHAQASAATGARPTITNALVGGGGHGNGSGDHQNGRALDLQGKGLARYGRHIRSNGGYASFHGTGRARHLHAVPAMGDTSSSRARSRATVSTGGGGGVAIAEGAIVIKVNNPSSNVDVEAAVQAGIRAYVQEREERS